MNGCRISGAYSIVTNDEHVRVFLSGVYRDSTTLQVSFRYRRDEAHLRGNGGRAFCMHLKINFSTAMT